jgi:hypothetical protein
VGSLLIWLSGAQAELLARCPTERAKYLGIGSAILLTAAVAGTSMTFALHTALKAPLPVAIAFAVAWGLAIMSLDRWLVVSLQRQSNPLRYLVLAAPRVLLALLLGFVISTPFVLQIFRPEIEQQIALLQSQSANAYAAHPPLAQKVAKDRAEVASLEELISTGGQAENPDQDPTVMGLMTQLHQTQHRAAVDFNQWQCQLYGVSNGMKCKPGPGPLAAASHQRYLRDEAQIQQTNDSIRSAVQQILAKDKVGRATAISTAQAALPTARQTLATDLSEQSQRTAAFDQANAANAGLLLRLQALSDLTANNGTLNVARWMLFALFTAIECLPVLVKVLLNLGAENTYEKVLASEEKMRLRVAAEQTIRRQAAETIELDSIISEAQRTASDRDAIIPVISEQTVAAEQRVALALIAAWEAREMRNVADGTYWRRPGGGWTAQARNKQEANGQAPPEPDGWAEPEPGAWGSTNGWEPNQGVPPPTTAG